jgi:hypothetical protein
MSGWPASCSPRWTRLLPLGAADDEITSIDRVDYCLIYLANSDVVDHEVLDQDWALLDADRVEQAVGGSDDVPALEGQTRVTTEAAVHWRCYPKHGDGEFYTGELGRADLERLRQMLLVPEYAHLARWVDPTVPQPDLRTREGQALWKLFGTVMEDANKEGSGSSSGADDAAALYAVLSRFGLRVP